MRALSVEGFQRAAQKSAISLKVFLAGPFIRPSDSEPTSGSSTEAARLRYRIFKALETYEEIKPTLGEHEQLQQIYKEHFGEYSNAALAEMAHVAEQCDCVIILPSSPGSFSELGYFSAHEDVCEKMLILLDARFEGDASYINLGPVALAAKSDAEPHHVNYEDFDTCWSIVKLFLERHKSKKLARRYRVGRQ